MSKVKIDKVIQFEDHEEENQRIAEKYKILYDDYEDEDADDYRFRKSQARRKRELDY